MVNQYTSVAGTNRTHDSNGNLTDDGTYKFGYDFENRLLELRSSSTSALIATYRYDALGWRVQKALSGGPTTRYVLDGPHVVEEYDGSDNWQALYVYEHGIDHPRCMDRADIADVSGNSNTTDILRFHYHQQALGCVTELTQPTGAVVEWVTYDVYGLPTIRNQSGIAVTQSPIGNPYLYTGREYDAESSTYFYRARTCHPATGTFLQRDTLGYVDGPNAYMFARDCPATNVDPLELDTIRVKYVTGTSTAQIKENVRIAIDAYNASAAREDQITEDQERDILDQMGESITDEHGDPITDKDANPLIRIGLCQTYWALEIRDETRPALCGGWGRAHRIRARIGSAILVYPDDGILHHELGHILDYETLEEEFGRRFPVPYPKDENGDPVRDLTDREARAQDAARRQQAQEDLKEEKEASDTALHDDKGYGPHEPTRETTERLRAIEAEEPARQNSQAQGGN